MSTKERFVKMLYN